MTLVAVMAAMAVMEMVMVMVTVSIGGVDNGDGDSGLWTRGVEVQWWRCGTHSDLWTCMIGAEYLPLRCNLLTSTPLDALVSARRHRKVTRAYITIMHLVEKGGWIWKKGVDSEKGCGFGKRVWIRKKGVDLEKGSGLKRTKRKGMDCGCDVGDAFEFMCLKHAAPEDTHRATCVVWISTTAARERGGGGTPHA
jgi:hypothetical protein